MASFKTSAQQHIIPQLSPLLKYHSYKELLGKLGHKCTDKLGPG